MIPSDDKVRMMVRRALKALEAAPNLKLADPDGAKRALKKGVEEGVKLMAHMDEAARAKVESLSRNVREGTREYDELYRKYLSEERRKRGL